MFGNVTALEHAAWDPHMVGSRDMILVMDCGAMSLAIGGVGDLAGGRGKASVRVFDIRSLSLRRGDHGGARH